MGVDIIARGLAVNNGGGGGGGDRYTNAQIDEMLSRKQDLITVLNKLSSNLIAFNISEEDIVRIFGQAEAEQQTEYEVNGNTIKFLTDVTTDGDVIKFETDSTFVYKDNIYLQEERIHENF